MLKKTIKMLIFILALCGSYLFFVNVAQAKTVASVVKHSRDVYYGINGNLQRYTVNQIKGEYKDYWDMTNKRLVKGITYPTSSSDMYIKKYTTEYYYDKNRKLVFAFAYRRVKGKLKEYRAYYGTDGKLYRYIAANGKVINYRGGQKIKDSSSLKYQLYRKGTYYLALASEGQ